MDMEHSTSKYNLLCNILNTAEWEECGGTTLTSFIDFNRNTVPVSASISKVFVTSIHSKSALGWKLVMSYINKWWGDFLGETLYIEDSGLNFLENIQHEF